MKTETMKNKVNTLILTGKTKFRKGGKLHLISPKTHGQLFDFLHHYKGVNHLDLKRLSDNLIQIIAKNDDQIVIFGSIEVY